MTKKQKHAQDTMYEIIELMNSMRISQNHWAVKFLDKLKKLMEKY